MNNNQPHNRFKKMAKCKAATCIFFLTFIFFLFVIVNPLNASDSGVSNLKMNKKYYLYLDRVHIFKIHFKKDNTFIMRRLPEKPSLFNYIRADRMEGVYVVCEDLLRLFWYEKFSRKKRLLYEVEAKIDEDYRIKAVSVKTKKC